MIEVEFEKTCKKVTALKCINADGRIYIPLIHRLPDIPLNFRFETGSKKKYIRLETLDGEAVGYAQLLTDEPIPNFYYGQQCGIRTKGETF